MEKCYGGILLMFFYKAEIRIYLSINSFSFGCLSNLKRMSKRPDTFKIHPVISKASASAQCMILKQEPIKSKQYPVAKKISPCFSFMS